jgi:hypothetical protein
VAYEGRGAQFIISARKTARLVEELKAAEWKPSPRTDADGQCEFRYQPQGWEQAYRFMALRYKKKPKPKNVGSRSSTNYSTHPTTPIVSSSPAGIMPSTCWCGSTTSGPTRRI